MGGEERCARDTTRKFTRTNEHACLPQHRSSRSSLRQRRACEQRALRRRARAAARERAVPEIGERRDQRRLVVAEAAQPEIALAAEQAAHFPLRMAMIDA